jgi:Aspartyl/Asparaginyl beta-hydroxylase
MRYQSGVDGYEYYFSHMLINVPLNYISLIRRSNETYWELIYIWINLKLIMNMEDFNFKLYGNINVGAWKDLIDKMGLDWDKYDYRQKNFAVHKETLTIPLIWNELDYTSIRYWDDYPVFKPLVDEVQQVIEDKLGLKGMISTAMLIKMKSGANIPTHFDKAYFFRLNRRLHIPVSTNQHCMFTVSDETINMKEGEIWEINNDGKPHGVCNKGATDRIHLLIDWKEN